MVCTIHVSVPLTISRRGPSPLAARRSGGYSILAERRQFEQAATWPGDLIFLLGQCPGN